MLSNRINQEQFDDLYKTYLELETNIIQLTAKGEIENKIQEILSVIKDNPRLLFLSTFRLETDRTYVKAGGGNTTGTNISIDNSLWGIAAKWYRPLAFQLFKLADELLTNDKISVEDINQLIELNTQLATGWNTFYKSENIWKAGFRVALYINDISAIKFIEQYSSFKDFFRVYPISIMSLEILKYKLAQEKDKDEMQYLAGEYLKNLWESCFSQWVDDKYQTHSPKPITQNDYEKLLYLLEIGAPLEANDHEHNNLVIETYKKFITQPQNCSLNYLLGVIHESCYHNLAKHQRDDNWMSHFYLKNNDLINESVYDYAKEMKTLHLKAQKFFLAASKQGNDRACIKLANQYWQEKRFAKAKKYYALAIDALSKIIFAPGSLERAVELAYLIQHNLRNVPNTLLTYNNFFHAHKIKNEFIDINNKFIADIIKLILQDRALFHSLSGNCKLKLAEVICTAQPSLNFMYNRKDCYLLSLYCVAHAKYDKNVLPANEDEIKKSLDFVFKLYISISITDYEKNSPPYQGINQKIIKLDSLSDYVELCRKFAALAQLQGFVTRKQEWNDVADVLLGNKEVDLASIINLAHPANRRLNY